MLAAKHLHHSYGFRPVLRDLNLSLGEGEVVLLGGANGSGKTTLVKILSGLLKPLGGSVSFSSSFKGLNVMMHDRFLYPDLTLRENLEFFGALYQSGEAWQKKIFSFFNLESFAESKVCCLSHGERVCGALCRALMADVSLYLLDEPLGGLDEEARKNFVFALKDLKNQGRSFLVTGHDFGLLDPSRQLFLRDGKIF